MSKLVYKAYRFRLYPNEKQRVQMAKTFGSVRFVYNHFLDEWNTSYKTTGKGLSESHCKKALPLLKTAFSFLKEVDSIALQSACEDLAEAFGNFFAGRANKPVFKSKKRKQFSYTTKFTNGNIALFDKSIKLPKLGLVRAKISRVPTGRMMRATVSMRPNGHYYVSILVEEEVQPFAKTKQTVGLDMGIAHLVTTSDGVHIAHPHAFSKYEKKLARAQRTLSRRIERAKKEGRDMKHAKNIQKARLKVANIHERISNIRRDYVHKLTTAFVRDYDIIAVEKLTVSAMLAHKPLAKSIADASWRMIREQLAYKCEWYGKTFIGIEPAYTSQTCANCHTVDKASRKGQWFTCKACGHTDHADVNASKNIKRLALASLS